MAKKTTTKKKTVKPTGKLFKVRSKEYLVTKNDDNIIVTLKGEKVFSTKESGKTYKEWLFETRK